MLKKLIVAVGSMLLIAASSAAPDAANTLADAQAQLPNKCSQGCLILSPAEIAELEQAVNAFAQRAFQAGGQAGYEKGIQDLAGAAAANPRICPKNI